MQHAAAGGDAVVGHQLDAVAVDQAIDVVLQQRKVGGIEAQGAGEFVAHRGRQRLFDDCAHRLQRLRELAPHHLARHVAGHLQQLLAEVVFGALQLGFSVLQ